MNLPLFSDNYTVLREASRLGLKIGYLMSGVLPDTVKIPMNGYVKGYVDGWSFYFFDWKEMRK